MAPTLVRNHYFAFGMRGNSLQHCISIEIQSLEIPFCSFTSLATHLSYALVLAAWVWKLERLSVPTLYWTLLQYITGVFLICSFLICSKTDDAVHPLVFSFVSSYICSQENSLKPMFDLWFELSVEQWDKKVLCFNLIIHFPLLDCKSSNFGHIKTCVYKRTQKS